MKSIKDLREQYNLITEKEEHDMNKLTQLVRAGLFDAKKLSALKRAMDKPADKMTAQEKRMMINLLDALMAEVLSDKQVYRKIKQDVMKESVVVDTKDYLSKIDPRVKRYGYSQKDAPSVLLLKRKAIRVFPDGEKVALYYAQSIDKYVSIPFSEIGINENWITSAVITSAVRGIRDYLSGDNSSDNKKEEDSVAKELKPLAREKTKLNVGGPKDKDDDGRPDAIRSRTERLNRLANQAMAKDVRESFQNKLEVLREFAPDPKIVNPRKRIKELKDKERLDKKNQRTRPLPRDRKVDVPKEQPKTTEIKPKSPVSTVKTPGVMDTVKSFAGRTLSTIGKTAAKISLPYTVATTLGTGGKITPDSEEGQKFQKYIQQKRTEKISKDVATKGFGTQVGGTSSGLTKPKADFKGTSAFTGMPSKSAPKVAKLPQAPKNPNVGITSISEPPDAPETEAQKKLKVPLLNPAKDTTTGDTPGYKTSSDSATAGATSFAQPWKGAGNWKQPTAQPSPSKNKPKTDDGGTGRREPEDKPPRKKPGFKLPKLAPGDVGAKALSAMAPGLKLAISGPKREGDADAIRSRMSSVERKALQAQANIKESIELDGNLFELNNKEAQKVTALYESLNKKNKKKMVEMMNESAESLEKVISFAVRQ